MEYIRYRELRRLTDGMGRTTVWRLEKAAKFPRRRQISPGTVAWPKEEVEAWLQSRPAVEDEAGQDEHTTSNVPMAKRRRKTSRSDADTAKGGK